MVDASCETDFRGFEWIVGREMNAQEENTGSIWTIGWAHYSSLPMEQIITNRSSTARAGRVSSEIIKFLGNALESHIGLLEKKLRIINPTKRYFKETIENREHLQIGVSLVMNERFAKRLEVLIVS